MDFEFDESKLLYGLGAFLGVVSILYFGQQLILDLSPAVKAFILLSGTVMFIGAAEYIGHGTLQSSFYIFSAFSYLSFMTYIFARFQFSSSETFLVLAASSAAFIAMGYFRSEKGYEIGKDQAKNVLLAVLALVALLVIFDVAGSQPEYSLELHETVEVTEGEEFELGVFEIKNSFPLSRNVDVPTFRGCLSVSGGKDGRNIYIRPDSQNLVSGGTTDRIPLMTEVNERHDQNATLSGNYTIERGECPSDPAERTIYIDSGNDRRIISSAVE